MKSANWHSCVVALLAAFTTTTAVAADDWPNRAVRIIVPFGPGGGVDTVTRVLAEQLNKNIANRFVVENRSGAGGTVGTSLAAQAAPDGYTFNASAFEMSINPTMRPNLSYKVSDFIPISDLAHANYILSCHPSVPAKSVKELIALAKKRPGLLNYGTSGLGGGNHLTVELFSAMAGIKWTHIPYKGAAAAVVAVISGEIDCSIGSTNAVAPHVRSGRVRGLGVTGSERSPIVPDLPRIAEAGVPGYKVDGWYGFYTRTGTPQAIVDRMAKEVQRAIRSDEARRKLAKLGNEAIGSSPAEFRKMLDSEIAKWARLVKQIGLKPLS